MTAQIERRGARAPAAAAARGGGTLAELMHEGFYMLFMLQSGATPPAREQLMDKVRQFLADLERDARQSHVDQADIDAAKYAFCAALDEIMLALPAKLHREWQRKPLQLVLFGDQLAGEHFFDRLEELRGKGGARLQALHVFHLCLLLGFKGKYAIDGDEKLSYLTSRLGDEIAHHKGKSRGFAPRAERPDQIVQQRRSELSLWVVSSVFVLVGVCAFIGLRAALARSTQATLAQYADLVRLAPRPAHLTITLP